ncbi:PEP-utilizing enzyme [Amycolatopsis sp. GM8]|uniref:PEP-utilizing enzyme n=1 Tax=Amycolatopsis sp. GM8 TaxID=2896530 RepID=UPI001EEE6B03|nr:PEP-utilizing enzyme [Amycolatopsis sp. GM8]
MRGYLDTATRFEFGTKAETLTRLAELVRTAVVLPLEYFTVAEWRGEPEQVLTRLCSQQWSAAPLIVRSSGYDEDRTGSSLAGRYLSQAHVSGRRELRLAIEKVVDSFDSDHPENQVLVQPQFEVATASGVVSSYEPSCGAPYRVVNWTSGSDTTEVTSGGSVVKTWYFLDGNAAVPPAAELEGIPELVLELEELIGDEPFEFEFAATESGALILFQVRPLAGVRPIPRGQRHAEIVAECQGQVRALNREQSVALGKRTVLGIMPDWNPAEMIGVRPRPLATSLYRTLITDSVWAESRARYGYRDLRGVPLLVDLGGLPYIDARASFTSMVPASLDDVLARRLVEHYIETLRGNPQLHDKIEFTIALTCYHFNTPDHVRELIESGILPATDSALLTKGLRELTIAIMADHGPFAADLRASEHLARTPVTRPAEFSLSHLEYLLTTCRRRGTLPFSGLARAAFVATSMVRSLVELGVLTATEADALLGSANTVSTVLLHDFATLTRDEFLARYGHLRPGSYDILSPRYDEAPDLYFDWSREAPPASASTQFEPSAEQLRAIRELLVSHSLPGSPERLLEFVAQAVAAREYSKLHFTRFLSEILVEVARAGARLGFTPDDMSYLTISALCDSRSADRRYISELVRAGKERHEMTEILCAPAVLTDPAELTTFVAGNGAANFVTQSRVIARVADVAAGDDPTDAIAAISAADPGYDWIFTKRVKGLLTAFGGANSHMAIRALELGIPAAIGVGKEQFEQWQRAGVLEIDAGNRMVRAVGAGRS